MVWREGKEGKEMGGRERNREEEEKGMREEERGEEERGGREEERRRECGKQGGWWTVGPKSPRKKEGRASQTG